MACIILVEDNTLIREAVSGYLQLDNHQTIEFGTTDGVMETIERNVADLAILDVMLPDGKINTEWFRYTAYFPDCL